MSATDDAAASAHAEILDEPQLGVLYQPIISMERREIVGFHAIARAPDELGGDTGEPLRVLAAEKGSTAQWDWLFRATAFEDVLNADLPAALSLVVGIEPQTLDIACPEALAGIVAKATTQLRVFIELDGPALLANPAGMLDAIRRARAARWGVVLRGLADHVSAAALLDIVEPDVLALELANLGRLNVAQTARVLNNCFAYRQATGTALLIRGVDQRQQLREIEAWQPEFVEGEMFGARGTALETAKPPLRAIPLLNTAAPAIADDPYDAIAATVGARTLSRAELVTLSRILEHRCLTLPEPPIVLACQHRELFLDAHASGGDTAAMPRPWFTAILTSRPGPSPSGDVVCVRLPKSDPLAGQRILAIMSDDFAVVLAARRTTGSAADDGSGVVLSYDRTIVDAVGRALLSRIPDTTRAPAGRPLRARPAPLPPLSDEAAPDTEDNLKRSRWPRLRRQAD